MDNDGNAGEIVKCIWNLYPRRHTFEYIFNTHVNQRSFVKGLIAIDRLSGQISVAKYYRAESYLTPLTAAHK